MAQDATPARNINGNALFNPLGFNDLIVGNMPGFA
jgi:hypothetical protein